MCESDRSAPFYARFSDFGRRAVEKALGAFGKFVGEPNFPLVASCDNRLHAALRRLPQVLGAVR